MMQTAAGAMKMHAVTVLARILSTLVTSMVPFLVPSPPLGGVGRDRGVAAPDVAGAAGWLHVDAGVAAARDDAVLF
jgi:hypothetical protein